MNDYYMEKLILNYAKDKYTFGNKTQGIYEDLYSNLLGEEINFKVIDYLANRMIEEETINEELITEGVAISAVAMRVARMLIRRIIMSTPAVKKAYAAFLGKLAMNHSVATEDEIKESLMINEKWTKDEEEILKAFKDGTLEYEDGVEPPKNYLDNLNKKSEETLNNVNNSDFAEKFYNHSNNVTSSNNKTSKPYTVFPGKEGKKLSDEYDRQEAKMARKQELKNRIDGTGKYAPISSQNQTEKIIKNNAGISDNDNIDSLAKTATSGINIKDGKATPITNGGDIKPDIDIPKNKTSKPYNVFNTEETAALDKGKGFKGVFNTEETAALDKELELKKVVDDTIKGKYGNGADRIAALKKAGYSDEDIERVQSSINKNFKPIISDKSNTPEVVLKDAGITQANIDTAAQGAVDAATNSKILNGVDAALDANGDGKISLFEKFRKRMGDLFGPTNGPKVTELLDHGKAWLVDPANMPKILASAGGIALFFIFLKALKKNNRKTVKEDLDVCYALNHDLIIEEYGEIPGYYEAKKELLKECKANPELNRLLLSKEQANSIFNY